MRGVTATRLPSPRGNPDDALRTRPFGGPAHTDSAPHDNDASELRVQDLDLNLLKTFRAVYEAARRPRGAAARRHAAVRQLRARPAAADVPRRAVRAHRHRRRADAARAAARAVGRQGARYPAGRARRRLALHARQHATRVPPAHERFRGERVPADAACRVRPPRAGRGDRDAARRRMPAQRRTRIRGASTSRSGISPMRRATSSAPRCCTGAACC